jgi:hypothetical protein
MQAEKSLGILYSMKHSPVLKNIHVSEMLVLTIFILYLIFPVATPSTFSPYIESPLGMIVLFSTILSLFLYSHPIVAVLFLFVAYTLLRRSAVAHPKTAYVQYTESTPVKMKEAQQEIDDATPPHHEPRNARVSGPQPVSLEEEIVAEKAPIGVSDKIEIVKTAYLPVSTNVMGASTI